MTTFTEEKIEILALSVVALALASTMALVPVWCGVFVAYIAYLRASGVKPVSVIDNSRYSVVSLNLSNSLSVCLVVNQKNRKWALQVA